MSAIDVGPSKGKARRSPDLVALWAAFSIWVAIHAILFSFFISIPVLWVIMATVGREWSIAAKLSTRTIADRLAWITFSVGIYAMLGVVCISVLSEGEGALRSWPEIRRQVRMFVGAGIVAVSMPILVTIGHYLIQAVPSNRSKFPSPSD